MTNNKGKSIKSVRGWRRPKQGGQSGGPGYNSRYHQRGDGTHDDRSADE